MTKYISEKRAKVLEYKKNYEWLVEQNSDLELWDEDECRKELPVIVNQIQVKQHITKQNSEIKKKIEKVNQDYNTINNDLDKLLETISDTIGCEGIAEEIEKLKEKLNTKEQLQEKLQRRKEKIDTYLINLEKWNQQTSIKNKLQDIDVTIIRDGETIPLDSLSGGEFDRVALALFLAFNKVSKSKLIMLDECLSSLHAELVEDIVDMIKTKLHDKMVLITLHQANTGMFDNIIDIEGYRCCD